MSSLQDDAQVITVLGATGNQGRGVVQALLEKDPKYHVRAITRDVSSSGAMRLSSKFKNCPRLRLLAANLYDKESLIRAFDGAYGVFAVTNNRIPGQTIDREEDMDHELEAGRNIVDAAKVSGSSTLEKGIREAEIEELDVQSAACRFEQSPKSYRSKQPEIHQSLSL